MSFFSSWQRGRISRHPSASRPFQVELLEQRELMDAGLTALPVPNALLGTPLTSDPSTAASELSKMMDVNLTALSLDVSLLNSPQAVNPSTAPLVNQQMMAVGLTALSLDASLLGSPQSFDSSTATAALRGAVDASLLAPPSASSSTAANTGAISQPLSPPSVSPPKTTSHLSNDTPPAQDIMTSYGPAIQGRFDTIPDFGAHPTIVSVRNGAWSDPNTWGGRLPTAGDVVEIAPGTTVTYDVDSTTPLQTVSIEAGATLQFRTDINTTLTVSNLLVKSGGTLDVGTADNPVAANVQAAIVFPDVPLDTTNDPLQFGHGLIGLGTVTMYGAARSEGFINLAAAAHAGDTSLTLADPATGWQVGDKLYLPDTHQLVSGVDDFANPDGYVPQYETVKITGISADGKTLYLSAPLQFDHLGSDSSTGPSEFLPQVADLTRNVVVRSANPYGTRGYVLFEDRANVDIHDVGFLGLGRTTNDDFDDTTFDDNGQVTHIGTNQEGRYPVSFRHLIGQTSPQADGYQYTFMGNVVTCPIEPMNFRWGVDIDDSDYGLIQDNVLDNWAGAGMVTEAGSEVGNVIQHNFVTRINGDGGREVDKPNLGGDGEMGQAGVGFWFRGPDNIVRNNVANDIRGTAGPYAYGYEVFAYYLGDVQVPAYQGADPTLDGQSLTVDMNATPLMDFSGNEVYGATYNGLSLWWLGTNAAEPDGDASAGVVKNFRAWNVSNWGYYGYETQNLTLDGFTVRGDTSLDPQYSWTADGLEFSDYFQKGLVITNADIRGCAIGIDLSSYSDGTTVVENSYLSNQTNLILTTMCSVNGSEDLPARRTEIDNVRFDTPTGMAASYPLSSIVMEYNANGLGNGAQVVQDDEVYIHGYNGVAGNDFRVYYYQQAPDYVVPQTGEYGDGIHNNVGSPDAGLTNQQSWDTYGIAIAGAVAPSTATDGATLGINGLVAPIS